MRFARQPRLPGHAWLHVRNGHRHGIGYGKGNIHCHKMSWIQAPDLIQDTAHGQHGILILASTPSEIKHGTEADACPMPRQSC